MFKTFRCCRKLIAQRRDRDITEAVIPPKIFDPEDLFEELAKREFYIYLKIEEITD